MVSAVEPSSVIASGFCCVPGAAAWQTRKLKIRASPDKTATAASPNSFFMEPPELRGPGKGRFSGPVDRTQASRGLAGNRSSGNCWSLQGFLGVQCCDLLFEVGEGRFQHLEVTGIGCGLKLLPDSVFGKLKSFKLLQGGYLGRA